MTAFAKLAFALALFFVACESAIPQAVFVQRGYYVLFRDLPPGGMQIITDTPDPLPGPPATSSFRHWDLPAWFPRKALIVRASIIYESVGYNTVQDLLTPPPGGSSNAADYLFWIMRWLKWERSRSNTEAMLWVDPGGTHFNDAVPPGSENVDYSKLTLILHKFDANPMFDHDTGVFKYPIVLDRDAGDKLAVQFNNADAIHWAAVSLSILVPFQP